MVVRPICEPVELPLGATVLAERVEAPAHAPTSGRFAHFHDVCELVLFGAVKGHFHAEGRRHDLSSGMIAFIPSMRHHDFDLAPGAKDWTLVQIDPYIVEHFARNARLSRLGRAFCAVPDKRARERIATMAVWLVEEVARDPLSPAVLRIVELLLAAAAAAPEAVAGAIIDDGTRADRLFPALERLRAAPGVAITLEDAASACSLSPAYFSRRFKQAFGMNFTDYARTYRLHLAARRIATTGAAISDIAYGLGFSSPSHFSARFRERFGMSPRDYRTGARQRGRVSGEGMT